jgi:chromate transporter
VAEAGAVNDDLWSLTAVFLFTALFAVGGASALIPEFHRQIVDNYGWMTSPAFAHAVALAQLAPGPNVLIASLLGWQIAGIRGLLATTLAMVGPASVLALAVGRGMARVQEKSWVASVKAGLAPIVVGLMLASGLVTARAADHDVVGVLLTIVAAVFMLMYKRNPLWVIGFGALVGFIAHRAGWMAI